MNTNEDAWIRHSPALLHRLGCATARLTLAVGLAAASVTTDSSAITLVFDDKGAFLAQTGATAATTIPSTPTTVYAPNVGFTNGDLSFSLVPGVSTRFVINDVSLHLPGSELTLSGDESFDVLINSGPVFSFGFDFVEPEFDPNIGSTSTFRESTYSVTLRNGGTLVDSFVFSRPNDSAQFVGVWTGLGESFDLVEIRETSAVPADNGENEFFGQFYTSVLPVPEPSMPLLLAFAFGTVAMVRRKR